MFKKLLKGITALLAATMLVASAGVMQTVYADEYNATIVNISTSVNVRQRATVNSSSLGTLAGGVRVKVLEEVSAETGDTSGYSTWFKVSAPYRGSTITGYIASYYVRKDPEQQSTTPTTDSNFETAINDFPDSYKPYLRELHARYPNWVFHAEIVGADWATVLDAETQRGVSLVENTSDSSWQSKTWTEIVDSGRWVNASRAIVAYYLDPRNNLTENTVFQFMDLNYTDGTIDESNVAKVLNGTFMASPATALFNDQTQHPYAHLFTVAANEAASGNKGINPIFLATHSVFECGTRGSGSSNGATGYYNFYNIGAYSDAVNATRHGLALAQFGLDAEFNQTYGIPWNTPGKSIVGGARWIYNNYTAKGQDTLYYMRFNTSPDRTHPLCKHQYMTAIASCAGEANKMYNAYKASGIINNRIDFYIPVYSAMPVEPCPIPTASTVYDDFVVMLYNTLLGRTATNAEIHGHSEQLSGGTTASDLMYNNFIQSAEFRARNLSTEDYVKVLFRTLLNRAPSDTELANYTSVIDQGYTRAEIYTRIVGSTECRNYLGNFSVNVGNFTNPDFVDNHMNLRPFVVQLYTNVLGREPDRDGLRGWVNSLASGEKSGPEAAASFCTSAEMNALGLSNTEFVRRLYRVCFGREADEAGLASWVGLLDQHYTREYVVMGFVNSSEFLSVCRGYGISTRNFVSSTEKGLTPDSEAIRAFVTRLYELALERQPDEAGLNAWSQTLMNGNNGYDVAYGFIFSNEMIGKDLGNEEFLTRMYRIFLNREPDTDGFNNWLNLMNNGADRHEIFEGFVYSPEFAQRCLAAGFLPNPEYSL